MAKRAVFLNQDGVLHAKVESRGQIDHLSLIPGVSQAIRRLNEAGLFCCLISTASGLARGEYPISHLETLHKRLHRLLKKEAGAKLDAVYYCPYLSPSHGATEPEFTRWSTWQKPNTGMLLAAAWEHDLELKRSFVIGDEAIDIDLAHSAGMKGILLKTGHGKQLLKEKFQHSTRPDHIALNLADAVHWLINQ